MKKESDGIFGSLWIYTKYVWNKDLNANKGYEGRWTLFILMVGRRISPVTMEVILDIQKNQTKQSKDRITIWPTSNSGYLQEKVQMSIAQI